MSLLTIFGFGAPRGLAVRADRGAVPAASTQTAVHPTATVGRRPIRSSELVSRPAPAVEAPRKRIECRHEALPGRARPAARADRVLKPESLHHAVTERRQSLVPEAHR